MLAKRLLLAEAVLFGAVAAGIAVKEFPGLVREIKIWRMVGFKGFRAGSRHPR